MPKKVLFFCGASYVFGKEVVTLNLIKELRDKDIQVHCIVSGWNDGDFVSRLKSEGISYDEIKLGFFYVKKPLWTFDSLIHYPGALYKINKIIKAFKPDTLYFYSERTMFSVYPLILNRNIILHLNEPIENSKLNKYVVRFFRGKKIKYVVCSEFILSKLSALININQEEVHVIYNAIEVRERPVISNKNDFIHVGVVGQLRYHKGQDILLRALAKVNHYNYKCSVYGSGDREFEDELKALAKELGISNKVFFKGFEKDIDQIYSDLNIVVVPSRFEEPFGLVAIEPAQWRIPVIVSNKGGLPEVVQDGITGFIFEGGNVEDLSEKLQILMQNLELRQCLGANAFSRVEKMFSKRIMAESFLKIIS